jgi:TRAP-type C4-dicarboxylate transport system permease small subunit
MSTEELNVKSLYDRILDQVSHIIMIFTGVALVFMTAIFGWLVFGRYVLNSTPTWVEQASLLLVVYIGFLGAAVGVHKKTHLGVSVFREMSPEPVRRIFDFLSYSILGVFSLTMIVYGYKLTVFKWDTMISLINISEGWRSLPIMLSGVFVFLSSIGHLIHFFKHTDKA